MFIRYYLIDLLILHSVGWKHFIILFENGHIYSNVYSMIEIFVSIVYTTTMNTIFHFRRVPWCYHDNSPQKKDQLPPTTNLSSIRWQNSLLTNIGMNKILGLFVIVAWLSLFLPPEAIPGRVTMAMTTLLTLAAMFGSVRQNTPRVSYVSALDIWMCGCIIFVFFTLLEYVIVLWWVEIQKSYEYQHFANQVVST